MDAERGRWNQPAIEARFGNNSFAVEKSRRRADKPPSLFDRCHGSSPQERFPCLAPLVGASFFVLASRCPLLQFLDRLARERIKSVPTAIEMIDDRRSHARVPIFL